MAGFKAHFFTAAVVGGIGATSLLSAGMLDQNSLLLCFAAVVLGGILPDIDSDTSTVLTVSFTSFSIIFSFFIIMSQAEYLSTIELLLFWFGVFLLFKLVVFGLFTSLTVHRGIFHSIPAAFLSMFICSISLSRLYSLDNRTVWVVSGFLFIGFMIHLILDELNSLNIFNLGGVSKSFGTAIKFYSPNIAATGLLYLATATLYTLTPATDDLLTTITDPATWQQVEENFYPSNGWFTGIKFKIWQWWSFSN
ncbi:MAG: metal-dependent hydrolase [Magnetococcales bacterium]|nr:metal-dependent hydrolase [Magnetococcales bacterium]